MKQINRETQIFLESLVKEFEKRENHLQELLTAQSKKLQDLSQQLLELDKNYRQITKNYVAIANRLSETEEREAALMRALQRLNDTLSA